jgi:hypothetical protein
MTAEEANKLALSKQAKFEKRKSKNLKRSLNRIYYLIKHESVRGYFAIRWDYRDCMDRELIKSTLIFEGYNIQEYYPYYEIVWGNENEICHKKFK